MDSSYATVNCCNFTQYYNFRCWIFLNTILSFFYPIFSANVFWDNIQILKITFSTSSNYWWILSHGLEIHINSLDMAIIFIILKSINAILYFIHVAINSVKTNEVFLILQTLITSCINFSSNFIKFGLTEFTENPTFQTYSIVKCKIFRTTNANLLIQLWIILTFLTSNIAL